jgi:hypothetical protein
MLKIFLALLVSMPLAARVPSFKVIGAEQSSWSNIFDSLGIGQSEQAGIVVAGQGAPADVARLAEDHFLIIQGDCAVARQLGIVPKAETVPVRRMVDTHAPQLEIIWAETVSVAQVALPEDFQIFASEYWKHAPLVAGKKTPHGAVLWIATDPGKQGTERYPYLLQSLADVGFSPALRTSGLWAFFDSADRSRADVEYLARRWRSAGIAALHVAAWHNVEPDSQRDEYLKTVIAACHRNAILVYAWLELPHVSEEFWAKHPEWREKTGVGQDAQLDWRKLMNLQNAACRDAVARGIRQLLKRFDWDGVNMAELYFESLEGASNPARFTPMNDDIRREFQAQGGGFDPKLLFDASSSHSAQHDPAGLRRFLDFRARLASRMQSDWLEVVDEVRPEKPWLDVVLTHIDDRLEPGMRDALGADTSRSLPFLQAHRATVLVEDPAPLWSLGAARYAKLSQKWAELPLDRLRIAVDINVVERYQDVYPTKKQTGTELFQLVHEAARSFSRVALYFENSLERQDLNLLPVAAANASVKEDAPDEMTIESPQPVRLLWKGAAELDGKPWPFHDRASLLIPAGRHTVAAGITEPSVSITDFNGALKTVITERETVEFSYRNATRAIAVLAAPAASIEVDGTAYSDDAKDNVVILPAGEHVVTIRCDRSQAVAAQ